MGCGKSTIGRKLASKLNLQFVDLDEFIEGKQGESISDIFSKTGENGFRKLEQDALNEFCSKSNLVIATGGGTPCFYNNMEIINQGGVSIYIHLTEAALFSRLKNSRTNRPLLAQKNDEELLSFISAKLSEREKHYQKSHIKVDGLNLNTEKLIKAIDNYLHRQ